MIVRREVEWQRGPRPGATASRCSKVRRSHLAKPCTCTEPQFHPCLFVDDSTLNITSTDYRSGVKSVITGAADLHRDEQLAEVRDQRRAAGQLDLTAGGGRWSSPRAPAIRWL
jgi:hypothetical protein